MIFTKLMYVKHYCMHINSKNDQLHSISFIGISGPMNDTEEGCPVQDDGLSEHYHY